MTKRTTRVAQGALAAGGAAAALAASPAAAAPSPALAATPTIPDVKASVSSLSSAQLGSLQATAKVRLVHQFDYAHIDVGGCLACGLGGFDDRFRWDDDDWDPRIQFGDLVDPVAGGVAELGQIAGPGGF